MSKLIIPKENFSEIDIYTNKISVRFRIITDDKNVASYWSPVYLVDPGIDYITSGELIVEKHTGYVAMIWNPVGLEKDGVGIGELPNYDIWIRWGTSSSSGDWQYKERLSSTSLNLIKPTSPSGLDYLSVEVYRPGRPTIRRRMSDVYQDNAHIDTVNNVITFDYSHNFETGDNITYTSPDPIGGLSDNTEYYGRAISSTELSLYPTANDAISDTNRISLTSATNDTGFFVKTGCTVCDFLLYSSYNVNPV